MTTSRKYLDDIAAEAVNKKVSEIGVGTLFLGNPKAGVGQFPECSSSMGEGLWVRTPHGVAGFHEGCGYDGQAEMGTLGVVEGYIQVDAGILRIAEHLKRQNADLRFCIEVMRKDIAKLEDRLGCR